MVRESGMESVTARGLSQRLNASTKVIFGLFRDMSEVKESILTAAGEYYLAYQKRETAQTPYPLYKASGMAYIKFAWEEKMLFRLLFMRNRENEPERTNDEFLNTPLKMLMEKTGLSREKALLMHTETWFFVHGIAATYATNYLRPDEEHTSAMLTDVFQGILTRFAAQKNEGNNGSHSNHESDQTL